MPEVALDAPNYNLDLTLAPSFVSSLYERIRPRKWAKVAGLLGGSLVLEQDGRILRGRCSMDVSREELYEMVELESGLWHSPFEDEIAKLPNDVRDSIEALAAAYPGVRIAVAPHEFWRIFLAVLLSKRTSYNRFVIRWCRALWPLLSGPGDVLGVDMSKIGASYQLDHAKRSFASCLDVVEDISTRIRELEPEVVRLRLMRCWGVGPKVADATVLHTMKAPHFAPCDTHLKAMAEGLGWVRGAHLPLKALCKGYACDDRYAKVTGLPRCPAERCMRRKFTSLFGDLSGWVQTLAWLHGSKAFKR